LNREICLVSAIAKSNVPDMSEIPGTDSGIIPAPLVSTPNLDATTVLYALSDPLRWEIFKKLASGQELTGSDLASALGKGVDNVSKHLRGMREAGVVDLGFCTFRLANALPSSGGKD